MSTATCSLSAVVRAAAVVMEMTTGTCGNCNQPVTALNGVYACTNCGHSGSA